MRELTPEQKAHNKKIANFFKKIPASKICQEIAVPDGEMGCCVGAWLCIFYNICDEGTGKDVDFRDGADIYAKRMGFERIWETIKESNGFEYQYTISPRSQAGEMLGDAGATYPGKYAWTATPWKEHPSIIFERLSK